jgi:hypothetical protein
MVKDEAGKEEEEEEEEKRYLLNEKLVYKSCEEVVK